MATGQHMPDAEQSSRERAAAVGIVRTLRDAGFTAYFAGGCVRDLLLRHTPKDYDVATDARPNDIAKLFKRTSEVGAHFGVVIVREHGVIIEVATFRADGEYTDGRHPDSVTFAGEVEDARRRDFTINAMFMVPPEINGGSAEDPPEVIDHVGGLADLHRRCIRAVGEPAKRLAEDHLRALRAIRFAARMQFNIDPATSTAVREQAAHLSGVSRERIGDEVRRMLCAQTRLRAVRMLHDLELDGPSLAREHKPIADAAPTLAALSGLRSVMREAEVSLGHALAAWALDRGDVTQPGDIPAVVSGYRAALLLSNDERDAMSRTLRAVFGIERDWFNLSIAGRKRLASGGGPGRDRSHFAAAAAMTLGRDEATWRKVEVDYASLCEFDPGLSPDPFLDGNDLIQAGHRPGPNFARWLDAVYDAQLEGEVTDKPGAFLWISRFIERESADAGNSPAAEASE